MSTPPASVVRAIAFGDLAAGVWGAAWSAPAPFAAIGIVGQPPLQLATAITADAAGAAGAGEQWRLEGRGIELGLEPVGDPARSACTADEPTAVHQLCRVQGMFEVEGEQRPVDCLGRRSSFSPAPDPKRFESMRDVSAWFAGNGRDEGDGGVVVSSLRPRRARDHAGDLISAALLAPGGAPAVADPRLSTTYTAAGEPSRMTLELWLESDADEDRYPRRAAGETVGTRAVVSRDGCEFHAAPLRCHSRGIEGAGVYMLIRCA
ncbi:MAG: hypothetical protein ABSG43_04365 [Solirubrobacteraceae bacterium]|jgi:hypothetical protein